MIKKNTMWTFHVPILWILMLDGVHVYIFYYTWREICAHKSPKWLSSWHLESEVIIISIPSEHDLFEWFICLFPTIPSDLRMHKGDHWWITYLCRATYVRDVQKLSKRKVYCLLIVHKALWKQIYKFQDKARYIAFSLYTKLSESIYQISGCILSFMTTSVPLNAYTTKHFQCTM